MFYFINAHIPHLTRRFISYCVSTLLQKLLISSYEPPKQKELMSRKEKVYREKENICFNNYNNADESIN